MPSASGRQMREALANCRAAGIPCRTIPGIEELLGGKILTAQVRNLSVHDLLGRQPVHLDEAPVRASISNRSVLSYWRRRFHWFGTVPPDSPLRAGPSGCIRSGGKRSLSDRERAPGKVSGAGVGDCAR